MTPESAISLSSLVSPDARLELELLDDAVDDGLLDAPLADGDVPGGTPSLPRVEVPELPLAPLPNFTLFSTKPPPAALPSLEALDGLVL